MQAHPAGPAPRARSSPWPTLAACAALTLAPTGCATWIAVAAAPTLDTHAAPGAEGRLEAGAGVGNPTSRAYLSLAGGGGYLSHDEQGYGLFSPELGFEKGNDLRYGGGMLYTRTRAIAHSIAATHAW